MTSGLSLRGRSLNRAVAGCALAVALFAITATRPRAAEPPPQASWVSMSVLETPDGIRRAVNAALTAGIPALVARVPPYQDGGPDAFMELVDFAHEHRLLVYASLDVDRVALADEIPAAREHVVYQHPEWLMIPRALAPELFAVNVRSPEYVGRLSRWTRANGIDGLYLSPLLDDASAFVTSMAAAILKRYPVDGVQLEGARYPVEDFDYGRRSIEAFRREIRPALPPAERAQVDEDEAIDPFAYPNAFPDAWRRFRHSRLTRLVAQVRAAINSAVPGIPVLAVVSGAADTDLSRHLQDWRTWLEQRLVDAVAVRNGSMTRIVSDPAALVATADGVPADRSR